MILVVAGTYDQFRRYCQERGMKPGDEIRYVTNPEALLGMRDYILVKYGSWFERNDLVEIEENHEMNMRGRQSVRH